VNAEWKAAVAVEVTRRMLASAGREVRLVTRWIVDVHGLQPLGVRHGHALLVEEVALDAVGMPLHLHRPALDVVQHVRREIRVVLDEISLRQPRRGEEHLLEVGDRDLTLADTHDVIVPGARS